MGVIKLNEEPTMISTGIDAILSGSLVQSRNLLFLYTSHANKYAIQESFFAMSEGDEKLVFITCDEPGSIMSRFGKLNLEPSVIDPGRIHDLKTMDGRMRIITDGAFQHDGLEEFLAENKDNTVLCMYDLALLDPERLRKLAANHDRMILDTPDRMVLSAGFLKELDIADETIERFVKEYLDIVVLALIASKPMCGTDVIDTVHKDFNVLLSPGTIYPLLHKLKDEGLLECEYWVKKKVYKPAKGSEANIRSILDEHLLTNELINGFLKSRGLEANVI